MKKININACDKRNHSLDLVRTIAILAICFNHAISCFYIDQIHYETYHGLSIFGKFFMITSYIISRIGVPFFLFLTGALIIKKEFEKYENIKTFYKKNLLSLIISVIIWNILYYFIFILLNGNKFNFTQFLQIIFFMKSSVFGHMWYMPMIIGLYIFIPFISQIVKKYELKQLSIPLIIIFICYFVLNILSVIININVSLIIPLGFMGETYGLYIILGYYANEGKFLNKIKNHNLIIISTIFFIVSCLIQFYLYANKIRSIIYYNSFCVLISSLALFTYIIRKKIKKHIIIEYLSKNSLAIYFIHFPILEVMKKFVDLKINMPLSVLIFYIISIICSILIIEIFNKNKYIKKYLLRQ